ncbi:MAG TPA: HEAT repeat domain-containing protein [Promineifilum sp.]|nr:HEAT repeat domain-containing protein [Promineifilum sp.]HQF72044.1 HEAT repeat domain-containing protein [Promineifilum sp.]
MTNQRQQSFTSVLSALFNGDDVPVHLIYRLSDMEMAEFNQFQRAWASVDEARRAAIVRHMAEIAEENTLIDFTPVFAYLFDDKYASVRQGALDGVWDTTDPALIRPIINLLQTDPSVVVRAAAARALAHYVLLAEWGQIAPGVVTPIVDALLAEYEQPKANEEVKRAALEALASANHPRVPELIRNAYEDGSNEMQLSALFAMGLNADDRWLSIVSDEMESPSADFRAEAARAAGAIGNPEAIDGLEQLLHDEDVEVAIAAVYALGQIGSERATELLNRLADDPAYEDLYDAIDEALEEMDWMGGEFDLLALPDDEDEDENDDFAIDIDPRAN